MAPATTLPDGQYVPQRERLVYLGRRTSLADIVTATGVDCWQRQANAEIAARPDWSTMPFRERVLRILVLATDLRSGEVPDSPESHPCNSIHPFLTAPPLHVPETPT